MSNPYEGDSLTTTPAGLTGRNTASSGNGIGVLGTSANGEGVHGETNSTQFAAVAGIELHPRSNIAAVYGEQLGNGRSCFSVTRRARSPKMGYAVSRFMPHLPLSLLGWGQPGRGIKELISTVTSCASTEDNNSSTVAMQRIRANHNGDRLRPFTERRFRETGIRTSCRSA